MNGGPLRQSSRNSHRRREPPQQGREAHEELRDMTAIRCTIRKQTADWPLDENEQPQPPAGVLDGEDGWDVVADEAGAFEYFSDTDRPAFAEGADTTEWPGGVTVSVF
jgi:hypothetical protein